MRRITKKQVIEAQNRFFRERERWGENNPSTARAEITWRDLQKLYEEQRKVDK